MDFCVQSSGTPWQITMLDTDQVRMMEKDANNVEFVFFWNWIYSMQRGTLLGCWNVFIMSISWLEEIEMKWDICITLKYPDDILTVHWRLWRSVSFSSNICMHFFFFLNHYQNAARCYGRPRGFSSRTSGPLQKTCLFLLETTQTRTRRWVSHHWIHEKNHQMNFSKEKK